MNGPFHDLNNIVSYGGVDYNSRSVYPDFQQEIQR